MSQSFDASRSLTALNQDNTIITVVEMSQSSWLAAALIPGVKRQPLKKLDVDKDMLLKLLHRWRDEAGRAGHPIKRIVVAYEAGRDGFWLARWLRRHGIEAYVIHPSSIAVSREHRRAKTDRLDTELLMRAFIGWLRGEKRHCSMAAIPTAEEEDARRPTREREVLVTEQTRIVNQMTKRQRPRPVVQGANGRWPPHHAQDHDRGTGPQAAHRAMAARHHRRGAGGHHLAVGRVSEATQTRRGNQNYPDPRWRQPAVAHGSFAPFCRMGPPPRSFAADAHECIMVPDTAYKFVARSIASLMASSIARQSGWEARDNQNGESVSRRG